MRIAIFLVLLLSGAVAVLALPADMCTPAWRAQYGIAMLLQGVGLGGLTASSVGLTRR